MHGIMHNRLAGGVAGRLGWSDALARGDGGSRRGENDGHGGGKQTHNACRFHDMVFVDWAMSHSG